MKVSCFEKKKNKNKNKWKKKLKKNNLKKTRKKKEKILKGSFVLLTSPLVLAPFKHAGVGGVAIFFKI